MARNETAEGIVFRTHVKNFRGRELHSFCFDGSSDVWYRCNEEPWEGIIEEGFEVEIEFYEDNNGNLIVENAELIAEGDPVQSNRGGGRGRGGSRGNSRGSGRGSSSSRGRGSKGRASNKSGSRGNSSSGKQAVDWEAKDLKIQYQSARKDALVHVGLLVSAEAVKLPAKTKAKERQDAIDGLVDYYTALFFEDIADQSAVERAQEEREAPKTTRTKSKKRPAKRREEPEEDEDDGYDDDDDYEDED